jgi:hypothetical protein
MLRYGRLSDSLKRQLDEVVPSKCGILEYFPCRVALRDGGVLDRVYVVSEAPYIAQWGVYPEQDRGKSSVRIEEVVFIEESPFRLPAEFAEQIYESGESGMGYQIFTVAFGDGTEQAYLTGNAVDFIEYPAGKGPADVVSVAPHAGRNSQSRRGPGYYWCLHSEGEVPVHMRQMEIERRRVWPYLRSALRKFRNG